MLAFQILIDGFAISALYALGATGFTLLFEALLLALLAGWALNFISIKQLSLSLGGFIAHATARQA